MPNKDGDSTEHWNARNRIQGICIVVATACGPFCLWPVATEDGPQGRGYNDSTCRLGMVRGRSFRANQAQVVAIFAFRKLVDDPLQLRLIDEAHPVGGFFEASDFQSMPMFDRRD